MWRVLRARLGVGFECFASPLNCHLPRYCSAFPDVDAPFGSAGSFFHARGLRRGAFFANPPFIEPVVAAMTRRMSELLATADRRGERLTFVVVVPHWPDRPSWLALRAAPHRRTLLHLPQEDHGYLEGGQHYRPQLWRISNHDSSLFLLQSDRAAAELPLTPEKEAAIRAAFRTPFEPRRPLEGEALS